MKKILSLITIFFCTHQLQAQSNCTFQNPILAGFYPDPSICKVGNDYYLTNSTFAYFPGLPIFHSKDLVHWQQLGFALNRPEQLNLDSAGVSRGLFAPDISYHQGKFYIVCTLIDKLGNFIVTAQNPAGPWSNPIPLPKVDGIDPSLFFDTIQNKTYLVYNSVAPNNQPLYEGHRTIRLVEFDIQKFETIGKEKIIVNGGVDLSKKPIWIEGPHIFQKDGFYYLICAEGGTAYQHSEVVFRSKQVDGPYEPWQNNPILTQRQLNPNRPNPITTTGHAQFTQTPTGEWVAVFLGCRPYENDFYNTGRETFMAPVKWEDGWPYITQNNDLVQYQYSISTNSYRFPHQQPYNGNFCFTDSFLTQKLNDSWQYLRTPKHQWFQISNKGISMQLQPITCSEPLNPSFLGWRQTHLYGYASTQLNFTPTNSNEKAGLIVFQNEHAFYYLCQSVNKNKEPVIQLYRGDTSTLNNNMQLITERKIPLNHSLQLKINANGATYDFYYALQPNHWQLLQQGVDAKPLSTQVAGGFVGCVYALYATSLKQATSNRANFRWFKICNNDKPYINNGNNICKE
ncbi:glycoside hydrolase family 43 protein [Hydrotalea sandarakina]|jgi:alpha-N-arabinofuranosidase|uniref:Alpha-N-arabinofuranosidase n=1 Tax=Hydrotalea sandarakina TaxID=1004304 RepID=A0A2W7S4C4_9BACT|nr:glycoside hydrolase family 43 protein [Hydrotalea sandarakina]PZX61819.1 alpha-N-arabinofuranosidase [Hydrotalea sandarakina]